MSEETIRTQLYLAWDAIPEAAVIAAALESALPACLCVGVSSEAETAALAELRALCHEREVPLLVSGPAALAMAAVREAGLDGVHGLAAPGAIAEARQLLGPDAIVGAHAGHSRHDAMGAAEAGADYVALGPFESPAAERWAALMDLCTWWAATVEVPLVAWDATGAAAPALVGVADFIVPARDESEAVAAMLRAP